jgi:hypothetical protein
LVGLGTGTPKDRNRPIYMKITHEHPFDHRTDVDIKEIQRD